jgi:hypothetical protein
MPHSAPRIDLRTLVGQPAFTVEGTQYFWADILLAARAWGDWADLELEVRQGVACLRQLRATGQVLPADEEQAAAAEFRVARSLITATQAEAWLTARGLSVENWLKYIRRSLLRRKWAATLAELVARYPATQDQVNRALKVVGICSGHLSRFAVQLAGRAAVHARLQGEGRDESAASPTPAEAELPALAEDDAACELLGLAPDVYRAKREALGRLEQSFRCFTRQVVTPQAVRRQVVSHYADWVRVEYCRVGFPEEAMAQEAALCVRDDGEDLANVAARGRRPMVREVRYLEQIEKALHGPFLSAREGELLGPLPCQGEFCLFALSQKVPPHEENPDIHQRAAQGLLQGALEREIRQRVEWHQQL